MNSLMVAAYPPAVAGFGPARCPWMSPTGPGSDITGHPQSAPGLPRWPEMDDFTPASDRRIFVGGWQPAGDRITTAAFWLVVPEGSQVHYEAEVMMAGLRIATLRGPSRADVTDQLVKRYGRGQ